MNVSSAIDTAHLHAAPPVPVPSVCSTATAETEPSTSGDDDAVIEKLNDNDVYCGRDRLAHTHLGNKIFRDLVRTFRFSYQNARRRAEKTKITSEIIAAIHAEGGRFIKRDDDTGKFSKLDAAGIHDKVSHALRSAKAPAKPETIKEEGMPPPAPRKGTHPYPPTVRSFEMSLVEDEFHKLAESQQKIYDDMCKPGQLKDSHSTVSTYLDSQSTVGEELFPDDASIEPDEDLSMGMLEASFSSLFQDSFSNMNFQDSCNSLQGSVMSF